MDRNSFYDNLRNYESSNMFSNRQSSINTKVDLYNALQHAAGAKQSVKKSENKKIKDILTTDLKPPKYDDNQKAQKLSKAKHNKMYDKKFVDVIQNVKGLTNKQCLEEYGKYLNDPDGYSGIESNSDSSGENASSGE